MTADEEAAAETEAILADATLMAAIREGLADAKAGRISTHEQVVDDHVRRRRLGAEAVRPSRD